MKKKIKKDLDLEILKAMGQSLDMVGKAVANTGKGSTADAIAKSYGLKRKKSIFPTSSGFNFNKKKNKKRLQKFGKWLKKNNTKETGKDLAQAISEAKKTYKEFKNFKIFGRSADPFAPIHDPEKLYRWDKLFNT